MGGTQTQTPLNDDERNWNCKKYNVDFCYADLPLAIVLLFKTLTHLSCLQNVAASLSRRSQ